MYYYDGIDAVQRRACLAPAELAYLTAYASGINTVLTECVLTHLEESIAAFPDPHTRAASVVQRSARIRAITPVVDCQPDAGAHVVCRIRPTGNGGMGGGAGVIPGITLDSGAPGTTYDLHPGDIYCVQYGVIRPLILQGRVELL